ncbi:N-acetyl-gamma-glutamyl-phosphate reductase [Pseudidiomarina piscicola]|uniref:N-acetyl-gamma-glutamyl-phosphate reductase n=1 Tax=Pseudidiomarina piscicola TaxID=2614830 RepID=A0A6S6WP78_9GAMM|nr:N-acetyl-gamma-glutamyl-phosphate reductase [Pseudidiomarina piscicola]CAB0151437.1 N-acetyl-gamma-glutamyl-phosphate reductase [Pseudidiomarina piscicola]VZT40916.1 N-acetyl-gamma-glutamyl-phosphate reductase [Pseudomonas aeruginosa]
MSQQESINCAVFGASGYSGVELAWLLHNHPFFTLSYAFTSGAREAEPITALYPQLNGRCELTLQPWHSDLLPQLAQQVRVVFLALPHAVSAELAPQLTAAGLIVFDLSGAFRLADARQHAMAYGFPQPQLNAPAHYGIAEFSDLQGNEPLVAVAGCYPTAAALALRPLKALLKPSSVAIVNAVSGVTGAGRKAQLASNFNEVSLQAYGVANHRHQPEMAQSIGCDILFVPHLGNFKRGILATVYAELAPGTTQAAIEDSFQACYHNQPLVRLVGTPPKLQQVVGTPYCDIYYKTHGSTLILSVAIDNLLKGAASQAVQLANQYFRLPATAGLINQGAVV